jgi:hypothetical protein
MHHLPQDSGSKSTDRTRNRWTTAPHLSYTRHPQDLNGVLAPTEPFPPMTRKYTARLCSLEGVWGSCRDAE